MLRHPSFLRYHFVVVLWVAAVLPHLQAQLFLEPYAEIRDGDIDESSGLVKSRQYEKVYWTLNDSGDSARVFAITRKGKSVETPTAKENDDPYEGIKIPLAKNIDWEDIALDGKGNLLIGDFGNNENNRRDLAIYIVPEPNPRTQTVSKPSRRIEFHYPDQIKFPDPSNRNFDCESLFFANETPYFVSKNRDSPQTKLYRLDQQKESESNPLTFLGSFNLKGQATAADATIDGSCLAILTYTGVWLFEAPHDGEDYFAGRAYYRPIIAKQCEAICWDDDQTLIISNEQSELFELKRSDIPPFSP